MFDGILKAIFEFIAYPEVQRAFWTVLIAAATVALSQVAAKGLRKLLNLDTVPLPSASIVINIVRAVIWIGGGSIILDGVYGVNTNAIVTALGVGGIAVSLGFQDTLSNLIGGLQVTFMKIVKPGDNIEVGAEAGVVQDITWRHTTIKDSLGQTVIVPNSVISKNALVHLLPANRVAVPFAVQRLREDGSDIAVSLDAFADELAAVARDAADGVSPVTSEPSVFFSEVTEFGIKGKIILQVEDAAQTSRAADAIVRAIAGRLR